jgi:ATP-binding cassette, subfamily B, heavy metal transporter
MVYESAKSFYWKHVKPYVTIVFLVIILIFLSELANVAVRYMIKLFVDKSGLYLADELAKVDYTNFLYIIFGVTLGLIILASVFMWLRYHFGNIILTKSAKSAKLDVLKHLFNLDYGFFSKNKSGTLITRFTRIDRSMHGITESFFLSILPGVIQLVISLFVLFYLHWSYALIVIVGLAISVSFNIVLQKKQFPVQEELNEAEERENSLVADSFTNVETIKLYAKEEYMYAQFEKRAEKTREKKLELENFYRWFDPFNSFFPQVMLVAVFVAAAVLMINKNATLGDLFFVEATFLGIMGYLRYVLFMFRTLYMSLIDLDTVGEYLQTKPAVVDTTTKRLEFKKGEFEINAISFSYQEQTWMNDVTLKIPAKKRVAFVGKSGSGKSTLVKLLCRFYDVDKGQILLSGQDISKVTQSSLREQIAAVPQEGILFDDTIYNNLLFVRPTATKQEVFAAIKAAQLDDVIANLPKKEHTFVGERGVRLSGGERQRVSIARAILANRPIIFLDEATSALDSETEHKIQKALSILLKDKTAVIIAHRLSTIMHADKIVVLDEGKVVEEGTHAELLKKKGKYYSLWKFQKDGFIE